MAQDLFFPDGGQDKSSFVMAIASEIGGAQHFVTSLKERSEEVTSTDLDLSCVKPYDLYSAAHAIFTLNNTTGLNIQLPSDENLAIMQIEEFPRQVLTDYITAITSGYRQAALNILLGIGIRYKNAEGILPDFGPSRNTPHSIIESISEGQTILIPSDNAILRTRFEMDLQEIRLGTHEAWSEMFENKDHKTLATKYLTGKIKPKELVDTISRAKEPTINFKK